MPSTIDKIKSELTGNKGMPVTITTQLGRKKAKQQKGILKEVYPSVFIVELNDDTFVDRVSYSYTDVLTENIKLEFGDESLVE